MSELKFALRNADNRQQMEVMGPNGQYQKVSRMDDSHCVNMMGVFGERINKLKTAGSVIIDKSESGVDSIAPQFMGIAVDLENAIMALNTELSLRAVEASQQSATTSW